MIRLLKIPKITGNYFLNKYRHFSFRRNGNEFDKSTILGRNSILRKTKWGKYSGCNNNCIIVNTEIENFVNIAWNVTIGPRSHIYKNFTTHDFIYSDNEFLSLSNNGCFNGYFNKIGHDVWIGCHSIILPGVEIGNGSIVAAGSVVTKSVPPYAIVGGNPAKFIKWRFSKIQIKNLSSTEWYNWDIDKIIDNKDFLQNLVNFNLKKYENGSYLFQKKFLTVSKRIK